jgi:hypothetical protein
MSHDETVRPPAPDEARDRAAAAEWMTERAEGENLRSDIDGTISVSDASTPPDPQAYGSDEEDTLEVENHEQASADYPRADPHGGITEADRRS